MRRENDLVREGSETGDAHDEVTDLELLGGALSRRQDLGALVFPGTSAIATGDLFHDARELTMREKKQGVWSFSGDEQCVYCCCRDCMIMTHIMKQWALYRTSSPGTPMPGKALYRPRQVKTSAKLRPTCIGMAYHSTGLNRRIDFALDLTLQRQVGSRTALTLTLMSPRWTSGRSSSSSFSSLILPAFFPAYL